MILRFRYVIAALAVSAGASVPAAALDAKGAADLMTKAACSACHQIDKKLVGPPYKDIAGKYKGNGKAAELLAQKVRVGGMGVWGPIPMPPNPQEKISDSDLKQLIGWILSQ
jgi:cytochrome c